MQLTWRVDLRILLAAGLVCLLAACSSDKADNYQERSVDEIYNAAMELLLARDYERAALEFEEVERQHPYSIWAAKAQVMGAYAYFRRDRYDEAVNAVDRFIQLHPTSPDAPYAYYLKALAYYEQIVDVGRDQRTTLRALESLEDVVRRFPETQYARDATLKLDLTRDHLAGKEMDVGRFYLKRGELAAAVNRFKRVVELHQTTSHVPEALLRLSEAYTALGLDNEARRMTAILGHNYPGSAWYADAYELVEHVEVADFPRPDERAFYERWFDPDTVIAKAERQEIPDLRPGAGKAAPDVQVATAPEAPAAPETPSRDVDRAALSAAPAAAPAAAAVAASETAAETAASAGRAAEKAADAPARPTRTAAERAAQAAEAESQALAAKEAGGEWRRAAAQATTEAGRTRAEANVVLAEAAVTYWEARRAVAMAATAPEQATAEKALAEVSVGYWQAALGVAEDDLARRHASEALAQAEASRDYWRANGERPGWLERTLRSAI